MTKPPEVNCLKFFYFDLELAKNYKVGKFFKLRENKIGVFIKSVTPVFLLG